MILDEAQPMPPAVELEKALSRLLDELIRHRRRQLRRSCAAGAAGDIRAWTLKAIAETPMPVHHALSWVADPIEPALKNAMNEVGQILANELGDWEAFHAAVERICKPRSRYSGLRASAIDAALNGVTCGASVWCS